MKKLIFCISLFGLFVCLSIPIHAQSSSDLDKLVEELNVGMDIARALCKAGKFKDAHIAMREARKYISANSPASEVDTNYKFVGAIQAKCGDVDGALQTASFILDNEKRNDVIGSVQKFINETRDERERRWRKDKAKALVKYIDSKMNTSLYTDFQEQFNYINNNTIFPKAEDRVREIIREAFLTGYAWWQIKTIEARGTYNPNYF